MIHIKNTSLKVGYAGLIVILALTLPVLLFENSDLMAEQPLYRHVLQACLVGLIAIVGIWLVRTKSDTYWPRSFGLARPNKAFGQFLFGFGLIAVPLLITISLSVLFDWTDISFNVTSGILVAAVIGLVSTFFTDAITEELIFRGYIFGMIKMRSNTWKSSLITTALFVVFPIIVITIQDLIGIASTMPLSVGYLFTLLFFGSFVQYLRVLTGSIWTGVGFHLFFVQMNQLIGITDTSFIQFSETGSELPFQITLVVLLLFVLTGLVIYSIRNKRKNRVIAHKSINLTKK